MIKIIQMMIELKKKVEGIQEGTKIKVKVQSLIKTISKEQLFSQRFSIPFLLFI